MLPELCFEVIKVEVDAATPVVARLRPAGAGGMTAAIAPHRARGAGRLPSRERSPRNRRRGGALCDHGGA
jgi:hypothetical protein